MQNFVLDFHVRLLLFTKINFHATQQRFKILRLTLTITINYLNLAPRSVSSCACSSIAYSTATLFTKQPKRRSLLKRCPAHLSDCYSLSAIMISAWPSLRDAALLT